MPPISSLYQEVILDHYRRPRNQGELSEANRQAHVYNPTCGDEVRLQLRVEEGQIVESRFVGDGCSISQASASMMTQQIKGKTTEDALLIAKQFTALMHGEANAAKTLGDLRALAGVAKFPVRVRCALLGWNALTAALAAREPDKP
jgi:nitrogen fixation NifU-like protein